MEGESNLLDRVVRGKQALLYLMQDDIVNHLLRRAPVHLLADLVEIARGDVYLLRVPAHLPLRDLVAQAVANVNKRLPNYCQLSGYEVQNEEFAKTPKKSIKRFMYQ